MLYRHNTLSRICSGTFTSIFLRRYFLCPPYWQKCHSRLANMDRLPLQQCQTQVPSNPCPGKKKRGFLLFVWFFNKSQKNCWQDYFFSSLFASPTQPLPSPTPLSPCRWPSHVSCAPSTGGTWLPSLAGPPSSLFRTEKNTARQTQILSESVWEGWRISCRILPQDGTKDLDGTFSTSKVCLWRRNRAVEKKSFETSGNFRWWVKLKCVGI